MDKRREWKRVGGKSWSCSGAALAFPVVTFVAADAEKKLLAVFGISRRFRLLRGNLSVSKEEHKTKRGRKATQGQQTRGGSYAESLVSHDFFATSFSLSGFTFRVLAIGVA